MVYRDATFNPPSVPKLFPLNPYLWSICWVRVRETVTIAVGVAFTFKTQFLKKLRELTALNFELIN